MRLGRGKSKAPRGWRPGECEVCDQRPERPGGCWRAKRSLRAAAAIRDVCTTVTSARRSTPRSVESRAQHAQPCKVVRVHTARHKAYSCRGPVTSSPTWRRRKLSDYRSPILTPRRGNIHDTRRDDVESRKRWVGVKAFVVTDHKVAVDKRERDVRGHL